MSQVSVTFEIDGVPARKISLVSDRNQLMIYEQDLVFDKQGENPEWHPTHITYPTNFNYAHSEWMARLVCAAKENGNQGE
jgi:hypothetical protein